MAAELSGRVCCGLELDPKYVDVIIERWQKLTGKHAKLDGAGGTFHEVQLGRRQSTAEAVEENVTAPPGGQREPERRKQRDSRPLEQRRTSGGGVQNIRGQSPSPPPPLWLLRRRNSWN